MSFVADLNELIAASASGLHACPPGWPRVQLGNVAKVLNGFPFASEQFGSEGVPVIRIRDVVRGATQTRYAGEVPSGYWIEAGDLIVGMDGDFAVAQWRSERALLNQRVCKIIPDQTKVDLRYLRHILPGYLDLINANTPSVTVKHLSSKTLASIPLPLPSLETQQAIVARIDELFAEVEDGEAALARARADLETWRKALLKAAVTGELTADWRAANPPRETGADLLRRILDERRTRWLAEPRNKGKRYVEPVGPDTEGLPKLPEGWVWARVEQLTSFVTSGSRGWADYYADAGSTFIRAQNIKTDKLVLDDVAFVSVPDTSEGVRTRVQQWDILVTITGANVTKSALVEDEIDDAYVSQHVGLLRPVDPTISRFIYWWLVTQAGGRAQLELAAYGAGKPGLNLPNLLGVFVPLPPKAEQFEINAELIRFVGEHSLMDEACKDGSTVSATLRQSILAAAFRGALTA